MRHCQDRKDLIGRRSDCECTRKEFDSGTFGVRRACTTEAKATYDRDMTLAKSILTTR